MTGHAELVRDRADDQIDASLYNHYVGTFAQDSWRVTRNLTLNLGLRFEFEDGAVAVKGEPTAR